MSGVTGDNPYRASGVIAAAAAGGGISWQDVETGTTFTAEAGNGYPVNTTSNACTVTLPASASVGDEIIFTDYARNFATNALTIDQNSLNYQGYSSPNPVYDTAGESIHIVYQDATKGWIPINDGAVADEVPQSYTCEYLCIAGAGGGGANGGGGGAGGYRNSYSSETSGGGGSTETPLTLYESTTYTITVGGGGAGVSYPTAGVDGVNSSITGSDITDVTSVGGGGGGSASLVGRDGGSGGGGGGAGPAFAGGSGTANQGFDGGTCNTSGLNYGGGGGASEVGVGLGNGDGGDGLASSITGSSVTRAGGGGGGRQLGSGTAGTGGAGGGGAGNLIEQTASDASPANTGSGGGGSAGGSGVSGSASAGVVILRVPDASYSGTTTGSPTVATGVSGDTVMTFNASGSYTG